MIKEPSGNVGSPRVVNSDWQSGRVYFLAFLNPLVLPTVAEPTVQLDWRYRSCRRPSG